LWHFEPSPTACNHATKSAQASAKLERGGKPMQATLPTLLTLAEARAATGDKIPVSALRAAVRRGELPCIRLAESCSARIYVDANDLARWLNSLRGKRQVVLAPREVAAANRQAAAAESAQRAASGSV
jgi:hypothetical protein